MTSMKETPARAVSSIRQTFKVPVDGARLQTASAWVLSSGGAITAKLTYEGGGFQLSSRKFGEGFAAQRTSSGWERWDLKGPIDEGKMLVGIEFFATVTPGARGTLLIDDVEITEEVGKP